MLYLIFGSNQLKAIKKIQEIKKLFFKNNPNFLFEEMDGEGDNVHHDFFRIIENQSLFSKKRLLIFKNTILNIPKPEKFLSKYSNFLKESEDVFLFWEQNLKKEDKIFEYFKKNATKIQETQEEKKDFFIPQNSSVFGFVDKVFSSSGVMPLLHLESAKHARIDIKNLINVIFWRIKKMPQKNKRILNLAHEAILADLNSKIDSKNEEEHLSRLAISISSKV